jgi:PAS domain S-box-containing protein
VRPSRPSARSSDPALEQSALDLYENAPCGYLSTDPDGLIVRVNQTFLDWTGHARDALLGRRRLQDLLTAGGRIYHETHYAPLLRIQGAVREIAVDLVRADGTRLPVLMNSVAQLDEAGEVRHIRTTVFDATDRKRYERELLAARDRERLARMRTEHLQRTATALAGAPDAATIAQLIVDEIVASLGADRAALALLESDPARLRVLFRHGDNDGEDLEIDAEPVFDDGDPGGAHARLPLGGGPALSGVLWLAFDAPRPFSADDRTFLIGFAAQASLALERSRLFEQQRNVAHALQQSLLGEGAPPDPRFAVATLYQPAVKGLEVGGDWYDTFRLPGDKLGLVVGDVVGRGLAAASAMGQLRSAVRALAATGVGPARVLTHLDAFVGQVEPARFATVAYAEVDLATGRTVYACAGHLPPLLLDAPDAPQLLMGGRSTPLGVTIENKPRGEAELTLPAGSSLLLYTDGLVERRGEPIDAALDRLVATVVAHAGTPPDALTVALAHDLLLEDAGDDDVCLLLLSLTPRAA